MQIRSKLQVRGSEWRNINSILIDPNSKRSNARIRDRYHGFENVNFPKMMFKPNHESYNHKIVAEVDQNENV